MSIRIHPRTLICQQAENEMAIAILDIAKKHDLTQVERMAAVTSVAADTLNRHWKYQIRYERHGNGETPGDAES